MLAALRNNGNNRTKMVTLDLSEPLALDMVKGGNVAAPVGKINFSDDQLLDNINTFLNHLRSVKPAASKGTFIRTITISATMSPGIRVLA